MLEVAGKSPNKTRASMRRETKAAAGGVSPSFQKYDANLKKKLLADEKERVAKAKRDAEDERNREMEEFKRMEAEEEERKKKEAEETFGWAEKGEENQVMILKHLAKVARYHNFFLNFHFSRVKI